MSRELEAGNGAPAAGGSPAGSSGRLWFFRLSLDPLCLLDFEGDFVAANPAWTRVLGHPTAELTGQPVAGLLHPGDRSRFLEVLQQCARSGGTMRPEGRFGCVDGAYKKLSWAVTACAGERLLYAVAREVVPAPEQEVLRASQERLQAFMENSLLASFVKDEDGRYVYLNRRFRELFGRPEEELLGKTVTDLFEPDLAGEMLARDARVRTTGEPAQVLETYRLPGGRLRHGLVMLFPFGGASARRFLGGTVVDLTEQEALVDALRVKRELLQSILDRTSALVYAKDPVGRYVMANTALLRAIARPLSEILGKTDHELLPGPVADVCRANDQKVLRTMRPHTCEEVASMPDGVRIFSTLKFPLPGPDGSLEAVCGVSTDITGRKRAEEKLQLQAARQAALARLGRVTLAELDSGKLMEAAAASVAAGLRTELTGVLELQPTGGELRLVAGVGWLPGSTGNGRAAVVPGSWVARALSAAEPVAVQDLPPESSPDGGGLFGAQQVAAGLGARIQGNDGPWGLLVCCATATREYSRHEAVFLQSVANVLSLAIRRQQLKDAFLQSREHLRHSQKMEALGRLAGGVAHEFANLLVAISGHADLILGALGPEDPLRSDVETILRSASRAASLTHQLLVFSRRRVPEPRSVDLGALLSDLRPALLQILGPNIELDVQVEAGLGQVLVDPLQLSQAVTHLVLNSRAAMPQGGKLRLTAGNVRLLARELPGHPEVPAGDYVCLVVADTGSGMDAPTRVRAFDPFFTTRPIGQGSGLGLSAVHGIVQQESGHVWIASEPGKGTAIVIHLPRAGTPGD